MYERYTHTERTVIERSNQAPMAINEGLIFLYIAGVTMGAAVVAVVGGMVAALFFGGLAMLGLLGLVLIAVIPNAHRRDAPPPRIAQRDAPGTALIVRKNEVSR